MCGVQVSGLRSHDVMSHPGDSVRCRCDHGVTIELCDQSVTSPGSPAPLIRSTLLLLHMISTLPWLHHQASVRARRGVHLLQLTMATMAYNRGPEAASAEWVDARWNYVTSTKELVTGISNIFMEIFSVSDQFRGTIGKEKYWSTVACCLMFAGLLGCVDVCREQWCSAVVSVPSALLSSALWLGPAGVTMNI